MKKGGDAISYVKIDVYDKVEMKEPCFSMRVKSRKRSLGEYPGEIFVDVIDCYYGEKILELFEFIVDSRMVPKKIGSMAGNVAEASGFLKVSAEDSLYDIVKMFSVTLNENLGYGSRIYVYGEKSPQYGGAFDR